MQTASRFSRLSEVRSASSGWAARLVDHMDAPPRNIGGMSVYSAPGRLPPLPILKPAAVRDAVRMFSDSGAWRETMLRGMAKDFSWKTSARAYSALYGRLLAGVNL